MFWVPSRTNGFFPQFLVKISKILENLVKFALKFVQSPSDKTKPTPPPPPKFGKLAPFLSQKSLFVHVEIINFQLKKCQNLPNKNIDWGGQLM
jgi:hypothetical protein